jgi:putative transposase
MIFAHKIALDLTQEQEAYCRRAAGTARLCYNWGLAEWTRQYHAGEKPTAATLKVQWNAIKYERYPWLADIHRDAHAQPFANLHAAFQTFFQNIKDRKAGKTKRKVGYPTFKKKGHHDSFYIANDKLQIQGKRVRIPVLGWVRMREALRFSGKILAAVVSRTADRWFISVSVQVDPVPAPSENQAGRCGVDLGIRHLATLSTPREHIDGPKPLRAALKQLRRLNRELARRVKFSAHWHQTKRKLARLHARIAALRADSLHKLTTRLTQTYREIVIEDLYVAGMVQNRKLARAISDMGLGMFRQMLTYKAQVSGTRIIVADRWLPSSKLCQQCGGLHETLTLADRVFVCPACGFTDDRDFHAADNLEAYPRLVGNDDACGQPSAGQTVGSGETELVEAGTTEGALLRTF